MREKADGWMGGWEVRTKEGGSNCSWEDLCSTNSYCLIVSPLVRPVFIRGLDIQIAMCSPLITYYLLVFKTAFLSGTAQGNHSVGSKGGCVWHAGSETWCERWTSDEVCVLANSCNKRPTPVGTGVEEEAVPTWELGVCGNSLYFALSFATNLKLL